MLVGVLAPHWHYAVVCPAPIYCRFLLSHNILPVISTTTGQLYNNTLTKKIIIKTKDVKLVRLLPLVAVAEKATDSNRFEI